MKKDKTKLIDHLIWFSVLGFFVLIYIIFALVGRSGSRLGGLILMSPIAFTFGFYLIRTRFCIRIRDFRYPVYILLLSCYCFISSLWAFNPGTSFNRGVEYLELTVVMTILYCCIAEMHSIDFLLKIIMYGGFLVILFYVLFYGWSYVISSMQDETRVTSDLMNANSVGMTAAYALLIFFHYALQKKWKLFQLPFAALAALLLVASQSRKAIVIACAGTLGIFILNNLNNKYVMKTFFKVTAIIAALIIIMVFLSRLPALSGMMSRMSDLVLGFLGKGKYDASTIERMKLKALGKRLFLQEPLHGIGMDCPRYFTKGILKKPAYLHDNYMEILAGGGILGLIIYYWIYVRIGIQFLRYRNFQNREYNICLILFMLRLMMDYGMVSFVERDTYIYLMLFCFAVRDSRQRAKEGKEMKWLISLLNAFAT